MRRPEPKQMEVQLRSGDTMVVQSRAFQAMTDAGIVTRYRPAQRRKPASIFQRALSKIEGFFKRTDPAKTSEQGSGAASPTTYEFGLWQERYERRQRITDCRKMVEDDPRARRSVNKYAKEAVRAGANITVDPKASASKRLAKRAQSLAEEVERMLNPTPVNQKASSALLYSWAKMAVTEGDLFIQAITMGRDLVEAKRMPAIAMERITDDTDQFIDPESAYEQLDLATNETIATFPEAIMYHLRWDHNDGDRYGNPEIAAARRIQKRLELTEESQTIRRLVRASLRILWNVGTDENPGDWTEVDNFKAKNGKLEGQTEIFDPTEVARDYYGNGPFHAQAIEGDATIHEIEDILYFQNGFTAAGLPTPAFLYGLDCNSLNRDVMDALRAEWLKEVQDLTDAMRLVVAWLFELKLKLAGIHPDLISYSIELSDNSDETPSQVIDRTATMKDKGLISHKRAVAIASQFHGGDPDEEYNTILQEQTDKMKRDAEFQVPSTHDLAIKNGKTNGKLKEAVHA